MIYRFHSEQAIPIRMPGNKIFSTTINWNLENPVYINRPKKWSDQLHVPSTVNWINKFIHLGPTRQLLSRGVANN